MTAGLLLQWAMLTYKNQTRRDCDNQTALVYAVMGQLLSHSHRPSARLNDISDLNSTYW